MGGKKKKGGFLGSVGKAIGDVGKTVTKAVKDVGTGVSKGVGDTVSQVGRTVGSKDIVKAGSNITRESKKGMEQYAPLLTQLAGNALTGGAYGAVSSLGNMASSGKFDLGQAAGAVGSLAGFSPTMMQALQGGSALARGDLKGAALAGLGSLGSSGAMSSFAGSSNPFMSALANPNAMRMASSALTGDKKGLISGLAGGLGFGGNTSNLIGSLATGDKKGIGQSLGGALGFGEDFSRALGGAVTGNNRDLAMGLIGASGYMDPTRFKAIDELAGGKFSMDRLQRATQGLLPDMGMGGGSSGAGGGGSDWLKSIQNLGAGFSTSGLLPSLGMSGMKLPNIPGIKLPDLGAGGKGSENTAMLKDLFGFGDGFQAGRGPAGQADQGGFFDSIGDGFNDITTGIGNFVGRNRGLVDTGIGAAEAALAYEAGQEGFGKAKGYSKEQLEELQASDKKFAEMTYDPERYKQERKFIADRIAGGGITAEEKKMQQEGDIRAGRAAAGARAAALEQMARMGQGATGAGSALASALAGGQSVMGTQSETNLAREASASQRLEQDIQRGTNLSRQQTQEEADLAKAQSGTRLETLKQVGGVRGDLANMAMNEAVAKQNLISSGADLARTGLNIYESPLERDKRRAQEKLQAQQAGRKPAAEQPPANQPPANQPPAKPQTYTLPADIQGQVDKMNQPKPAVQPKPAPRPALPNPNMPTQGQVNQAINRGSYTIQKGDTLGTRYKDLGYSNWKEAYEANKDLIGDNPNLIKTGQTLRQKKDLNKPTTAQSFNNANTKK